MGNTGKRRHALQVILWIQVGLFLLRIVESEPQAMVGELYDYGQS